MNQRSSMNSSSSGSPNVNFNNSTMNKPLRESMSPEFIPFGYSSPLNNLGKRGHNFNNIRGRQRTYHERSGNWSFSSPSSNNSSFYSPYNNKSRFQRSSDFHGNRGGFRGNMRNSPKFHNSNDITLYFDKSMIEDPWKQLEEELKSKSQKVENESSTSTETQPSS